MLFPAEQAFVGRDEKQAPLKTPAWEAKSYMTFQSFIVEQCVVFKIWFFKGFNWYPQENRV